MLTQPFQIEQQGPLVIATVAGPKLGAAEAEALIDELANRLRNDGGHHFILHIPTVEHIDSSCIGVLVTFLQDLEHVRGRLVLAACQPNVAFLFKVTRLDSVFTLYDDLDEARQQIAHG
jgi:anti-sigma B factor antagonist